ncbi:MAG TPA: hypothetical protein VFF81_14785 [Noviherbaspirillum sp.]|nr:hypothetical protein [Noviherbaspirillum sp.]
MNFNSTSHIFLQDKGGIGKTLTASMFMQYLNYLGVKIDGVDADPQAPKLSRIKALGVPLIPLISNGEIQQRSFDPVFSHIVQSTHATLIDAGSGAFLPLLKYMKDNGLYDLLAHVKKQLFYHVVIISGPEKLKTIEGAKELLMQIKGTGTKVVIWQNEKEGIPMFDGKAIDETDWYNENRDQIVGIVKILDYNNSAFKADFLSMMEEEMTYREIMDGKSKSFDFMRQNRINRIFTDVFRELGKVFPAPTKAPKSS